MDKTIQPSFDGVIVENPIILDTFSNRKNNQYVDFKFQNFDTNGNYLTDTILLTVKRKNSRKENSELLSYSDLINTNWEIDEILKGEKEIKLDSCHKIYNLRIHEDFTFTQEFGDKHFDCSTLSMQENKEVGLEGDYDDFIKYHDKIQGHYLNVKKGFCKIKEDNILLIDMKEKRILALSIERKKTGKIYLTLKKSDNIIKMKKASR